MDKIIHRLEFLIALSVFLPVTIDALYKSDVLIGKDVVLNWGVVVGVLILCYLLANFRFSHIRNQFHENFINYCIVLNIFSFVPLLMIVGYFKNSVIYFPWTTVTQLSLYALFWLPITLFGCILLFPLAIDGVSTHKVDVKNGTYRKIWKKNQGTI